MHWYAVFFKTVGGFRLNNENTFIIHIDINIQNSLIIRQGRGKLGTMVQNILGYSRIG